MVHAPKQSSLGLVCNAYLGWAIEVFHQITNFTMYLSLIQVHIVIFSIDIHIITSYIATITREI